MLEETCHQPCPLNCRLTEWSEWTSCQDHCSIASKEEPWLMPTAASATTSTAPSFMVIMNTQSRYRRVLQWPQHGGSSCSRLIDVRPCPLQSSQACPTRSWRPQLWTSCLLPPAKSCGEGIQVRGLDCLFGGGQVDQAQCLEDVELMAKPLPVQSQSCQVDCVKRCVMGAWSSWSGCDLGCPSKRRRQRDLSHPVECANISEVEETPCTCQTYR